MLVRFYLSCSRPQLAHRVFNSIPNPWRENKTILCNQIIRAYAWDGPFEKAVDLYNEMVDSGTPTNYNFVSNMPFEPDAHLWSALLAACRIHKNIELGEEVSKKIQSLGPSSTGNVVLLFNLYTTAHRWDDAAVVRIKKKDLGFKKKPGCSWIEVNGMIHAFVGRDWSHPQSAMINKKLDELDAELKIMGYSAKSDFVYQDVEEKEKILLYHSEKLAVAFAIIILKADKPIIVTKNLRVCDDRHTALKCMTIIAKRGITVRDTSRFHHFREGICSCGEFW